MDGKCLRGAGRPNGSRVFVLTAVRHDDALTAALREIGAKTNEITEFAPLLDAIDDEDLAGAVVTVDALHAQTAHARYLVEDRGTHYLLSVKANQPKLARQLKKLPWKDVPVLDRSHDRGHGREEIREVQVVTVNGLLFPHTRQVVRIHRRRRGLDAAKWQTETVYAVTDLTAEQATTREIAAWARGHWIIENGQPNPRRAATQRKTTVWLPLSITRRSLCHCTAWANTRASTSRPAVINASGSSAWPTRTTSCSMMGPSSRSGVT